MSEWDVRNFSLNVFVRDLEAVVDAVRLDRFTLFGACQDAASAAAYAAKHPERVNGLILCNGTVRGWRKRLDPNEIARRQALSTLILQGWGQENPAYRQVFSSLLIPGGSAEQMDLFNQLERISTSPENAHRLHEAFGEIDKDISGRTDKIVAPVLILHSRDDAAVPFSQGQAYAAGIPGARLFLLRAEIMCSYPTSPLGASFKPR